MGDVFMDFKKMEQEVEKMKKVNEIFQLCMEINGFEDRQRSITGSKPTVFFDFSGHVAGLDIRVFETGWEKEKEQERAFQIYLYNFFQESEGFEEEAVKYEEQIKTELDNCIQYLKRVKEGKYEYLQQVI